MQADSAVELGRDDETLDLPWSSEEGPRYYDLKHDPGLVESIPEAAQNRALRDVLLALNAPASNFETAKCDTWTTDEINPEGEIFGLPWKFASYIDLLFSDDTARFSFETHEKWLKKITALLKRAPEIPASAEFILRRCRYHEEQSFRDGFYVTFYLFGYGKDESAARWQWEIALALVGHAIVQSTKMTQSLK